jgi:CHAD domain-containing protein
MRPLRRNEKIHDAIQLVVQTSTKVSVAWLTDAKAPHLKDEAIHDLRKQLKALRSLLKLVRADLGDWRYRRANRGLRDAGRPLAAVRDAKVILTTCNGIARSCESFDTEGKCMLTALERRLEETRTRIAAAAGTRSTIAGNLRKVEQLVTDWHPSHGSWKSLSLGLRSMYTKGRHALEIATADRSDSNLHELRKRSKDLLYACEFLGKASPRARSAATDLRRFTDLLGKHRDLAMLQGVVTARRRIAEKSFRSRLVKLAAREEAAVRDRALRIGLGIYDESAATFVRRVRRDWKTWRHNE